MLPLFISEQELRERFPLSMGVKCPADLRKIAVEDLPRLAQEYRDYLIEVCSKNGGHLGPSLGVIELTIALHRIFNSPDDKLVWDIGHQAYPHKLITGRYLQMQGLRQEDGVSGFCRRHESPHDIFGAGHAGTALSAAIGLNEAYRRNGNPHKVVAIMGDAGLTSGMVYEAMHQANSIKNGLMVILNDNEMSISPNVGAVNAFLSRKITSPFVNRMQEDVKTLLGKIPVIGDDMLELAKRVKNSVKNLIIPTVMFEGFGFHYYGPIDGHDLPLLMETIENLKDRKDPVLIHVITEKGRGYKPALDDKVTFHGCGPYDKETGKLVPEKAGTPPAYTKVFANTLLQMAKRDPKIVAITAAMPTGTGLAVFEKELPNQLYDVGISEQHAATFAGGLAIEGIKPWVTIYSTFMQRAYDQVIHDIAIQNLNVKFAMDRSGFVGADGATHNGVFDLSYMRCIPNVDVCAAKDERELQELLVAMDAHTGPAAIRYPRGSGAGVELYSNVSDIVPTPWGTGEIVYVPTLVQEESAAKRSYPIEWVERMVKGGKAKIDLVLVGVGSTVSWSVKAAESLKTQGIHALVVNARFVKPLDKDLFRKVAALCPRIISTEENVLMGGFGSALMEFYQSEGLLTGLNLRTLGIPDSFYEQATPAKLHKMAGIDVDSIKAAAVKMHAETSLSGRERAVGQI